MEKGLAWAACLIAAVGTTAIAVIGFPTGRSDRAMCTPPAALRARRGPAAAAQGGAAATMGQSRWIGIGAVLIIIALGNGLGSFMLRLLGRAFRRAQHLMSALGRLSDRDRLLAQLRSTSAVLGGVAGE